MVDKTIEPIILLGKQWVDGWCIYRYIIANYIMAFDLGSGIRNSSIFIVL
jgi:hypothetical protein